MDYTALAVAALGLVGTVVGALARAGVSKITASQRDSVAATKALSDNILSMTEAIVDVKVAVAKLDAKELSSRLGTVETQLHDIRLDIAKHG